MIVPEYFERVRKIPWADVLARSGISARPKASGTVMICCVFHGEKTASLKMDPNGYFTCMGCQTSGDVFTFVSVLRRWSAQRTGKFFARHFHVPSPF